MKNYFRDIFTIITTAEKKKFNGLVFLEILVNLLDLIFLALLILVVGFYTGTLNLDAIPAGILSMINGHPLVLIGCFLFLFALKNIFGFLVFKSQFRFVYKVAARLSKENMEHYLQGGYGDFVNIDSSIHTRRISQQTIEFAHHVLRGTQQVICSVVLVCLTVISILLFDAVLFGLLILMLLPAVFLVTLYTRKRLSGIRMAAREHRERSIQYLNEAIAGFVESNIYQGKEFFTSRFAKEQAKFNEGLANQLVMQNLPSRLMEVFAVLGLFLLVVINTYIFESQSLLLLIGAFMAAAYKIIPGIVRILNNLQQIRVFSYTIDELKKEKEVVEEMPEMPGSPIRSIELENLGFSYEKKTVISNENLKIEAGQLTGLSAPSGAGKTTILHIILGFLEQNSGEIYFNGNKASLAERRSAWPRISYARQQSFLIHDTIQNNITLTDQPDFEKLWSAINEAGLANFITEAEKGLDTLITENGRNISGGQRQRLVLARSLYRDADIYIFDEPFSELDRETNETLMKVLKNKAEKEKIILLVTHDPELLKHCSKIIRLNEN
jgi:ABC-type multidrug transport system fused ATPase/permease subunit